MPQGQVGELLYLECREIELAQLSSFLCQRTGVLFRCGSFLRLALPHALLKLAAVVALLSHITSHTRLWTERRETSSFSPILRISTTSRLSEHRNNGLYSG